MIELFKENGDFKLDDSIYVIAESEKEAKKEARKLLDKFIGDMFDRNYVRGTYRFTGGVHEFSSTAFRTDYEALIHSLAVLFNQNNELNMLFVTQQEVIIHADCDRLHYNELKWEKIGKIVDEIEDKQGNGLSLNIQRT